MADPPPVLTLLVEKGPRKGQCLQHSTGAVLRVGRVLKGNDLAVGDAGASQRHLELAFLPAPAGRWVATDLDSSNGTLLNDAALVPTIQAPLSHGDRIKIGESTVLAVSIAADAGPEPVATGHSTCHAATAVEEEENKAPAVRRGRRKAPAAVDLIEAAKGEAEVATRRGRRKMAPVVADPPEEEKEEAAVAPRRGWRRKAPARADPPEEEKEEATAVPRRGGRRKAPALADPPEEEKQEAAVVPRRGRRKKAVERPEAEMEDKVLPQPQQQTTRSTRAEALGTGQGKGEGEQTGRGRGRITRQSARKAAIHEDEGEGEVAVLEEQKGSTVKSAREKDDKVENENGTSNALAVQVALSYPVERTRKGRGRVRGSTRKAKDPVTEENAGKEEEDGDLDGARERRGNPSQVTAAKGGDGKDDEWTTGSGEVDGALKAEADQVEEEGDAPLAPRGQTQRAPNKRAGTNGASADREEEGEELGREEGSGIDQELRGKVLPESKPDSVGGSGENGKREVSGGRGEEGGVMGASKCPEGCSVEGCDLENMTLREWFVRIEEYILAKNRAAAQKAIAEVEEKHRLFAEYIKTLK